MGSVVYVYQAGNWWNRGVRDPVSSLRRFYGAPPRQCHDALRTWRQPRGSSSAPTYTAHDWQRGTRSNSRYGDTRAGITGWPVSGRPTDGAVRGPTVIVRGHVYRYANGQWWTRPVTHPGAPETPFQGTPPAECHRSLANWNRLHGSTYHRIPKIGENNTALPRERVHYNYNYFNPALNRSREGNTTQQPNDRRRADKWRKVLER